MSIEDVERILDETQESIEYQRVNVCLMSVKIHLHRTALLSNNCLLKLVLYIFYNRYSLENTYLSVTLICCVMLLLHYMSKQRVYSLQYVYLIILVTCYFADSDFM